MPSLEPGSAPRLNRMTNEQRGLMIAALTAFFGIAIGGPALTRLERRRRDVQARIARQAHEARARVERTHRDLRARMRRLGGGSIRR